MSSNLRRRRRLGDDGDDGTSSSRSTGSDEDSKVIEQEVEKLKDSGPSTIAAAGRQTREATAKATRAGVWQPHRLIPGMLGARPSPLSSEASSNSFRGMLNFALLSLALTNLHEVVRNGLKYGLLVRFGFVPILSELSSWPATTIFILMAPFVFSAYIIQKAAVARIINPTMLKIFQAANCFGALALPCALTWIWEPFFVGGIGVMIGATCLTLKLISYSHVNYHYHKLYVNALAKDDEIRVAAESKVRGGTAALSPTSHEADVVDSVSSPTAARAAALGAKGSGKRAIAEDELAPALSPSFRARGSRRDDVGAPPAPTLNIDGGNRGEGEGDGKLGKSGVSVGIAEAEVVVYPNNVTIRDLAFFLAVPVLVYDMNFPRQKGIRRAWLARRVAELAFWMMFAVVLVEQYIMPTVVHAVEPFEELEFSKMFERLLRLAIPNIYLWVLFFYTFFHLWLNILAEVTRFADRLFYRDWWNATTLDYFWSNWNIPVHNWLVVHMYLPLTVRYGISRQVAGTLVFFVSAVFHEMIVSIPFHKVQFLMFNAMMFQVPFAWFTRKYTKGHQIGNILMWFHLMLGQPFLVLMYALPYFQRLTEKSPDHQPPVILPGA